VGFICCEWPCKKPRAFVATLCMAVSLLTLNFACENAFHLQGFRIVRSCSRDEIGRIATCQRMTPCVPQLNLPLSMRVCLVQEDFVGPGSSRNSVREFKKLLFSAMKSEAVVCTESYYH